LARIQRRGSVRYPVPSRNPPVCSVALPPSGVVHRFRIIDISLSGMALVVEGAKLPIEPGMKLSEVRIEIPDVGAVASGLQVTYVSEPDSAGWRRVGCRFDELPI